MVEPIGKKLCQTRLAKGLTIEEAAHATRLRPEKIVALENGDYSRFGSNAYAKGFLQIYGRYLGVEVTEHVRALEIPHQVSVAEYQYLNNAPEAPKMRVQARREARPPSLAPAFVFLGVVFLVGMGFWINISAQRLGLSGDGRPASSALNAPAAETATPALVAGSAAEPSSITPVPAANVTPPAAGSEAERGTPAESPEERTSPEEPEAQATATADNELTVEPLKKTYVKIRKNDSSSAPIFEDFVYPGERPLKVRGGKFFVEVRDESGVLLRQNGKQIAYHAPGISIP